MSFIKFLKDKIFDKLISINIKNTDLVIFIIKIINAGKIYIGSLIKSKLFISMCISFKYIFIFIVLTGSIIFDPYFIQNALESIIDFIDPVEPFGPDKIEQMTQQEVEYSQILNTDLEKDSIRADQDTIKERISEKIEKFKKLPPEKRAVLGFYAATFGVLIIIGVLSYRSL